MACGRLLLCKQGVAVFQSNLTRGFHRGLEPETLAENMSRFQPGWKGGYVDVLSKQQFAWLADRGSFIARVGGNPGHFFVVVTVNDDEAMIWDPAEGDVRALLVEDLIDRMTGVVYR
jgi:hypothetical protein